MGSFIFLEIFSIVCLVSIITTLFNKRILGLPQAIGVPIVSALFVFLLQWAATLLNGNQFFTINIKAIEQTVRHINFYDFLINGVICFILTSSALKFQISDLKNYYKPIGILASIALLFCAIIFGLILFGYQFITSHSVPLIILLLLGSALGATDPIGIKGVLSSIKAPRHLMIKLEGESLFNDAMCIAVFMTILKVIQGGQFHLLEVIEHLLYEIAVAVIIGIAFGRSALFLLRGKNEQESLILITALLATGSYLVALYAHASAPIACVIGGLIVGNRWQAILEELEIDEINHFWHTIEGIINSFLFTLIGLELFILDLTTEIVIGGIVAFFILHIARFIANFASFALFSRNKPSNYYNGTLAILSWGGVRGGISLALILAVANIPQLQEYTNILIGYTFIVVLLSGVVCGLGLPAIINAFYHNDNEYKTGFMGYYQQWAYKLNRTGQKYILLEDKNGNQKIEFYKPNEECDLGENLNDGKHF